tara:strand:- start:580 stop:738 length:159 start_codon:yes stop_codon:yes gene_type:complete
MKDIYVKIVSMNGNVLMMDACIKNQLKYVKNVIYKNKNTLIYNELLEKYKKY